VPGKGREKTTPPEERKKGGGGKCEFSHAPCPFSDSIEIRRISGNHAARKKGGKKNLAETVVYFNLVPHLQKKGTEGKGEKRKGGMTKLRRAEFPLHFPCLYLSGCPLRPSWRSVSRTVSPRGNEEGKEKREGGGLRKPSSSSPSIGLSLLRKRGKKGGKKEGRKESQRAIPWSRFTSWCAHSGAFLCARVCPKGKEKKGRKKREGSPGLSHLFVLALYFACGSPRKGKERMRIRLTLRISPETQTGNARCRVKRKKRRRKKKKRERNAHRSTISCCCHSSKTRSLLKGSKERARQRKEKKKRGRKEQPEHLHVPSIKFFRQKLHCWEPEPGKRNGGRGKEREKKRSGKRILSEIPSL